MDENYVALQSEIAQASREAMLELITEAGIKPGQIVIVGCSTSMITGHHLGTNPNAEIGAEVFSAIQGVLSERGIYLAAQCCEHLNRAVIIERKAAAGRDIVNVVPTPTAGGSFAAAAYKNFSAPVALESIQADAGLDVGGTLIGMHLKRVAVLVRLQTKYIGKAAVVAARTRPPLIGGARAGYDESLL